MRGFDLSMEFHWTIVLDNSPVLKQGTWIEVTAQASIYLFKGQQILIVPLERFTVNRHKQGF